MKVNITLLKVINDMIAIWTPLPIRTERSIPLCGGRNTSPWTLVLYKHIKTY